MSMGDSRDYQQFLQDQYLQQKERLEHGILQRNKRFQTTKKVLALIKDKKKPKAEFRFEKLREKYKELLRYRQLRGLAKVHL